MGMPGAQRRQAGAPSRRAAQALALVLLSALGCLNLDLPDVPGTPPLPSLVVSTPRSGDSITLNAQVAASAASVNGIQQVSVLCGSLDGGAEHTVFTWLVAPYVGVVNFAVCQDVAEPNPDGGKVPVLQLVVQATTTAGAVQSDAVLVTFDATGPALFAVFAPTVQPKSQFVVTVGSDVELRSIPEVVLDLQPADSITRVPSPDGGPSTYVAFFSSTPGLGTDNPPYNVPVPQVPIEVLTDTDRTVRLTVAGTALNGNVSELDLSVELSRVVWDRFIPGTPASSSPILWAAEPIAFDGGLVLPLATALPASSASAWLPGRLDRVDGTFFGFDATNPALLPGGLGGGYAAVGLNAQGQTLFVRPVGNASSLLLAPAPPSTSPVPTAPLLGGGAVPPLTAVDNLLCLQDSVVACSTGTTEGLRCFDPSLQTVTATSGVVSTGPPAVGVVSGAGGRYLSPNVAVCGSSWNLVDLTAGTVSFGPVADPNGVPTCSVQAVSKLFAVGDGTFVVQLTEQCGSVAALPPEFPILRVGANSQVLGGYTAALGSPVLVQREVVGALADGRVVTLRNAPPNTVFELWKMNSTTADVTTPIAGLFDSADAVLGSVLAKSSYAGADGSFAVLLSGDTSFGAAVAAFAPNLQPRWLYLYPRIADAVTVRLVSAPSASDVYLVDDQNNHAVSLRVLPPPPAPPPPPDGGTGSQAAGIYVAVRDSVLVFPLSANGNTAPLRTITGAQTGLSQPIGVAMDSQGNLYVANRGGSTVTVYAPMANGNVAPLRTLTATTMGAPEGLAMAVGDDLFVAACPSCGETPGGDTAVFHFPAGATTNDFVIEGANTDLSSPVGIALGDVVPASGQQPLYVANSFGGDVVTFSPGATGNATPLATFNPGDETQIQSLAYGSNTLLLGDPNVGVTLFPTNASGNATPSSSLVPSGFEYPGGVFVDVSVSPPTVYLADWEVNALYVIHTAGTLPNLSIESVVTISGGATGLDEPLGVLVVK